MRLFGPTRHPDNLLSDDIFEFVLGVWEGPIKSVFAGPASIYFNATPLIRDDGNPLTYQHPLSGNDPSPYFDQPGVGEFDIRD